MIRSRALLAVMTVLSACAACCAARAADTTISKVMGSIDIGAGEHSGDVSTVNGSIHIGENAVVGRADTVNGSIAVERHATAAKLVTVNGSIHLKEAVRVGGTLKFERKVTLYVSDRATIGPVEGATAVRFSGDRPPG